MARACVFCGARARSREHLWPDWLNGVLPNYTATTHTWTTPGKRRVWTSAEAATQRIAAVCHKCNTGWMSRLEAAAKPVLVPMITGRKQSLDRPQQRTIAAWAFKMAVIGEQFVPKTASIPPNHRRWLLDNGEPPEAAKVFIAATDARWPADTHYHEQKLITLAGASLTPVVEGYVATVLIRHLAIQVCGSIFEHAEFTHTAPFDSAVARVWPSVRSVRWPPGPVLAPTAVGQFADHWRGIAPPNPPF
jgi:hypothetical protein